MEINTISKVSYFHYLMNLSPKYLSVYYAFLHDFVHQIVHLMSFSLYGVYIWADINLLLI